MTGDILIFLGPTVSVTDARTVLDAVYLPPVAQGDVYRACRQRPAVIGIIDGYFNAVPSVWHKEILWAITQGVRVLGASSMGALRAAELHVHGMVGVGSVFEQFRDGRLEDDDEVTVAHGPVDMNYCGMSEAMVNIRATVEAALHDAVVGATTAGSLISAAKRLFYPERDYPRMLAEVARSGAPTEELVAFSKWVSAHRRDVKREDALELLRLISTTVGQESVTPAFDFPYTSLWEQLRRTAGHLKDAGGAPVALVTDQVLDEVRADSAIWRSTVEHARLRALLLDEAQRRGYEVDDEALFEMVLQFRRERDLWQPQELVDWLQRNDLGSSEFLRLMRDQTALQVIERTMPAEILPIIDVLRLDGVYEAISARACEKRAVGVRVDTDPPTAEVYEAALAWHAQQHGVHKDDQSLTSHDRSARLRAVVIDYLVRQDRNRV